LLTAIKNVLKIFKFYLTCTYLKKNNLIVIQSDQTPIKVPYRFRTKGLQWLWIQTKFQIINNQTMNPKTYSIRGLNEVIGINEILTNKEILESSGSKKSHTNTSMVTNDLNEKDFLTRSSSTNALNDAGGISFESDPSYNVPLVKSNSSINVSIKSSDLRKDNNRQVVFLENGSSLNNISSSEKSSENKIDQNLGVKNFKFLTFFQKLAINFALIF